VSRQLLFTTGRAPSSRRVDRPVRLLVHARGRLRTAGRTPTTAATGSRHCVSGPRLRATSKPIAAIADRRFRFWRLPQVVRQLRSATIRRCKVGAAPSRCAGLDENRRVRTARLVQSRRPGRRGGVRRDMSPSGRSSCGGSSSASGAGCSNRVPWITLLCEQGPTPRRRSAWCGTCRW
jgi:hypothetical protein